MHRPRIGRLGRLGLGRNLPDRMGPLAPLLLGLRQSPLIGLLAAAGNGLRFPAQQLGLLGLGNAVELPGLGEQLVVLNIVRLAGNVRYQPGLHQLQRGATLGAEEAGLDVHGGNLQLAPGIHEAAGHLDVGLHFLAALGVRDDHLEAHLLQLAHHVRPIKRKGAGGQLQQKLAEAVAQLRGGLHPQALQLVVAHLETHGELRGTGNGRRPMLQLKERLPRRLEAEPAVVAMRRADDGGNAHLHGGREHQQGFGHGARPVVQPRKDMAVHIAHGPCNLSSATAPLANAQAGHRNLFTGCIIGTAPAHSLREERAAQQEAPGTRARTQPPKPPPAATNPPPARNRSGATPQPTCRAAARLPPQCPVKAFAYSWLLIRPGTWNALARLPKIVFAKQYRGGARLPAASKEQPCLSESPTRCPPPISWKARTSS